MPDPAYAVVLCCRANSERLPQKALAELAPGLTVLDQLIQRWKQSDRRPTIVLATPAEPCNDPLAAVAAAHGIPVSRNPPGNAVAEIDAAVRRFAPGAKYVARALADNPLVDISLADWRLDILAETGADGLWYGGGRAQIEYQGHVAPWTKSTWENVPNKREASIVWVNDDESRITYAGTTDVWSRSAWNRIVAQSEGNQLEHPGLYYWQNISDFMTVRVSLPRREYLANVRTELDTLLDLELFQAVWAAWQAEWQDPDDAPACVSTLWALKWLAAHPLVANINRQVQVKTQTKPLFASKGRPWICEGCQHRIGHYSEGDLHVVCQSCGKQRVNYSLKQNRGKGRMGWVP